MSDDKATNSGGLPTIDFRSTHIRQEWKHTAPLLGCAVDPTGRFVCASSMDQTIQRWDLSEDQHTALGGHDSWLRAIGFSVDGRHTFTGGYDGRLCIHDSESDSPEPKRQIEAHDGWIRRLAVHPTGHLIATGGNDLVVKLWDAESGKAVRTLSGHEKHVYSLLFHPNGKLLLTGDLAGVVKIWNVESGQLVRTIDAKGLYLYHKGQKVDYGGVRCMSLSPDGNELACGGLHKGTNPFAGVQEPLVLVFDWESGKQLRTHEATGITRGIAWRLSHNPDGTIVGASGGGTGGFLLFWQGEKKTEVHKVKLPNTILDMAPHPNGIDIVTAHHDGRIRISRMAAKA